MASSQYDSLLCSKTLVTDRRHISELLVPGFGRPVLVCRDRMILAVGWLHMCEMDMRDLANSNLSLGCCKMLVFRVCGARQNSAFSLYRNPDLDDRIYDCLP